MKLSLKRCISHLITGKKQAKLCRTIFALLLAPCVQCIHTWSIAAPSLLGAWCAANLQMTCRTEVLCFAGGQHCFTRGFFFGRGVCVVGLLRVPGHLQNLMLQPIKGFIDSHSGTGSRGSTAHTRWGKHCNVLLLHVRLKSHSHMDLSVLSDWTTAFGNQRKDLPQLHSTSDQSQIFSSLQCGLSEEEASFLCLRSASLFLYDSKKLLFLPPKNPYGVF